MTFNLPLEEIFHDLPEMTLSTIDGYQNLTTQQAISLVESCFNHKSKDIGNVVKGSTKLLSNGGYEYKGVSDVEKVQAWCPFYGDKGGEKAHLYVGLEREYPPVYIRMTDNFLDLELLKVDDIKKSGLRDGENFLSGGFALNNTDSYQTSVSILYNKPFGNQDYKIDDRIRQQILEKIE